MDRPSVPAPLSQARLSSTRLPAGTVERPRLGGAFDAARRTRLTLVHAPAGYGKSTLLAEWHRTIESAGEETIWLAGHGRHRPAALFRDLAAVLRPDGAAAKPTTADAAVAAAAIDALSRKREPVTVFVDDLEIDDAASARILSGFVRDLPDHCRLIAASRRRPDMPLARLRASGRYCELGAAELAFDAEEMTRLLRLQLHADFGADAVARFNARIGGWPAGVRLATLGASEAPTTLDELSISGANGYIADFFAEEVMHEFTDGTRSFLRGISVFNVLSAELCDRATGRTDSADRLREVERLGGFLQRTDVNREHYALHPLFREFLRGELAKDDSGEMIAIAGRGSAFLEASGQVAEALNVAIGVQDWARTVDVLNACCPDATYKGRVHHFAQFVHELPKDILKQFPRVLLTMAWAMSTQRNFVAAHELLDLATEYLKETASDRENADRDRLKYLLDHGEMMIAQFTDNQPEAERRCLELLSRTVEIDPYVVGSVESSLLYAQREQFNLKNLAKLDASALARFRRADSTYGFVWNQSIVGPSRCMAGDTDGAIRALGEGVEAARAYAKGQEWFLAGPACLLAEVHYERNELKEARSLLEAYRGHIKHGFVDQMIAGHVTWARLLAAEGNVDDALAMLAEYSVFAKTRGIARLHDIVAAERIRLLLLSGRANEALQLARSEGLAVDAQLLLPVAGATTATEARAFAWTRLARAEGRIADALRLARRWAAFTLESGAIRSAVRWDILIGHLKLLEGDDLAARRQVRKAASTGAPGRFVRAFLDEGETTIHLLAESDDGSHRTATATDAFVEEILRASDTNQRLHPLSAEDRAAVMVSPLTSRETEIAALVAAGLSNREIGQRLGMTEGSVKWHLQQVYDKIGIRRRAGAIRRIRELGLIP